MIQLTKNITPFIDFGFGDTSKSVSAGQPVTVWLNTIYAEGYEMVLYYSGATMVKVSNYEYQLTYASAGEHEVYLQVSNPAKTKTLISNTLTLTIE